VSPAAKGRGALIVLNDRIASAYYSQKTNGNTMDTFKAYEQGVSAVLCGAPLCCITHPRTQVAQH